MPECASCGEPVDPDHAFCQVCGTRVDGDDRGTVGGATTTDSGNPESAGESSSLLGAALLAVGLGFTGFALVAAGLSGADSTIQWSVAQRWAAVGIGGALLFTAYGLVKRRSWGWALGLLAYAVPIVAALVDAATGEVVRPEPLLVASLFAVVYLLFRAPYFGVERRTVGAKLAKLLPS